MEFSMQMTQRLGLRLEQKLRPKLRHIKKLIRFSCSFCGSKVSPERPVGAAEAAENPPRSRAHERPRVARVGQPTVAKGLPQPLGKRLRDSEQRLSPRSMLCSPKPQSVFHSAHRPVLGSIQREKITRNRELRKRPSD